MSNLYRVLRVVHQAHVSRLSPEQTLYPAGYGLPLPFGRWLSLLGPSFPAEELCPSCVGPTGRPPDLIGVSTFRTEEMRPGWMPSLLRNLGALDADIAVLHPWFSIAASAIFRRRASLTEPQRWFTCVHPSGLPLARHESYGSARPWTLTPSSKAARYQATPRGGGRAWTLARVRDHPRTTPSERPRVAPQLMYPPQR